MHVHARVQMKMQSGHTQTVVVVHFLCAMLAHVHMLSYVPACACQHERACADGQRSTRGLYLGAWVGTSARAFPPSQIVQRVHDMVAAAPAAAESVQCAARVLPVLSHATTLARAPADSAAIESHTVARVSATLGLAAATWSFSRNRGVVLLSLRGVGRRGSLPIPLARPGMRGVAAHTARAMRREPHEMGCAPRSNRCSRSPSARRRRWPSRGLDNASSTRAEATDAFASQRVDRVVKQDMRVSCGRDRRSGCPDALGSGRAGPRLHHALVPAVRHYGHAIFVDHQLANTRPATGLVRLRVRCLGLVATRSPLCAVA